MPKVVDHNERKNRIAEAVARVASKRGFSATTFGNVAIEAGMSKGWVRHYFPTRKAMLTYVTGWLRNSVDQRLSVIPEIAQSSPIAALHTLLTTLLPRSEEERMQALLSSEALVLEIQEPEIREKFVRAGHELIEAMESLLKEAQRLGEIRSSNVFADAAASAAMLRGLISNVVLGQLTAEEAAAVIDHWLQRLQVGSVPVHRTGEE